MLILHKPWKHNKPLIKIFLDEPCPINYLKDTIKHKQVPHHVLAESVQAVKYSQQHRIQSLARDKPQTRECCVNNMNHDEAGQHIMLENSNNLSPGTLNICNNHVVSVQVDIGLTRNWSEYFFQLNKGQ